MKNLTRRTLFASLLAGLAAPFVKAAPAPVKPIFGGRLPGLVPTYIILSEPLKVSFDMEVRLMAAMQKARDDYFKGPNWKSVLDRVTFLEGGK